MVKQFKKNQRESKVAEKSNKLFTLVIICLFSLIINSSLISSASCGSYGYSCSGTPSSFTINETTTNVNNSDYLDGYDSSYFYPYYNPYSFYNSTTLPNLNSSGLIKDWNADGYIKDWNNTGLIINWSIDTSNFYLKSNPFSFWNDTYATFNKTYADTLYATIGAGADNSSWNQSLADTLYYGIGNSYGFYNSTNPQPMINSSYYLTSNPYAFYNETTIPFYILSSNEGNLNVNNSVYWDGLSSATYHNSNWDTAYGYNSTGLIKDWNSSGFIKDWNSTGLIANWSVDLSPYYLKSNPYAYYNSTTIPDFALNLKVDSIGNWTLDKPNYLTSSQISSNYYPLNNPYSFYNITSFDINNYYLKSNPYGYYNITSFDINNYYLKNNPFNFYNSTNFVISDYYLKSNPYAYYNSTTLTSNSQLLNGNNYWNDTYATFNKTYADTLYADIKWNYNQTTPAINTILGFNYYNSTNLQNLTQLNNDLGIGNWTLDKTNYVNLTILDNNSIIRTWNGSWITLNVGNWSNDKSNYYTKSDVNTNITNTNTSMKNYVDTRDSLKSNLSGGNSFTGQQDFNGGWTSNGLSIINGDIYAQTGYFYNISSLQVNTLVTNGSLVPTINNSFNIGNSTLNWKDAYFSGVIYEGGKSLINKYVSYNEATNNLNLGNYNLTTLENIGIGTTTPQNKLNVIGDANITNNLIMDNNKNLTLGSNRIYSNTTCIIIKGSASTLEVC